MATTAFDIIRQAHQPLRQRLPPVYLFLERFLSETQPLQLSLTLHHYPKNVPKLSF